MSGVRGMVAGLLGLTLMEAITQDSTATKNVGGLIGFASNALARWLNPYQALIPDLRSPALIKVESMVGTSNTAPTTTAGAGSTGTSDVAYSSSSGGSSAGATAVSFALAQQGKPYVYAGNGPDSYDCSGLVKAAWAAAGVTIPRTSMEDSQLPGVPLSQLQPGDLVTYYFPVHHVAMYIGGGNVISAMDPKDGIGIRPLGYAPFPSGHRPAGAAAPAAAASATTALPV